MALKTASVLAFERKLSNSDALMYSGKWQNRDNNATWAPIQIKSKDVRGTISNRLKAAIKNDPTKLNAELKNRIFSGWMWQHCHLMVTPLK